MVAAFTQSEYHAVPVTGHNFIQNGEHLVIETVLAFTQNACHEAINTTRERIRKDWREANVTDAPS